MDEIQKGIDICLKNIKNPHLSQDDRKVVIAELTAYISEIQSRNTRALATWTRILVAVTSVYAVIALVDLYFKYFSR